MNPAKYTYSNRVECTCIMVADLCHLVISFCHCERTIILVYLPLSFHRKIMTKTTWNNKINKALISVAKYFAPLFIIFLPRYLSSRNHHELRYYGANWKDAILRPFIFSLFRVIMWNNNNKMKKRRKIVFLLFRGEKINYEKKQNCIFLTLPRNKEKKQNCVFSTSPGNNEVYRYFVVKRQWIAGLKDDKKLGKTFHGAN